MSNYCGHCPYDHRNAVGGTACPFTTLYWDFLDRHEARFRNNPRMNLQLKNLEKRRSDSGHMAAIRRRAEEIRSKADL
jgi:deoxyribodipyrimidine photolyase-related protein